MKSLLATIVVTLSLLPVFSQAEEWQNINDILGGSNASGGGSSSQSSGTPSSQHSSTQSGSFSQAARQYEKAVGVVVILTRDGRRIPIGTAWGVKPGKFATNAHISAPVTEYLDNGLTVQVQLNNSSRKILNVVRAKTHPAYNKGMFDVGVLEVEGGSHDVFRVADTKYLRNVGSGEQVAFMGFPMEELQGDNINIEKPLASVQIGNIVALSDFSLKDSGFENNYSVRHSIPATGGASGSPIFTADGTVVALLNAGNIFINIMVDPRTGKVSAKRKPSAAQINFGVRVDLINDLL